MDRVYNPGCALLLYKPDYMDRIMAFLSQGQTNIATHNICCRHEPKLPKGFQIINTCAGCDKRFSTLYDGITTVSLWEILSANDTFPFPKYDGITMTIHDPCPVRDNGKVHDAIRTLLGKMNIKIIEAENTRANSICCGDSFYPKLSVDEIHSKMKERAGSMPCQDVCVYCVSCIKAMHIGGKKPRYILDLLFNESTEAQVFDTVEWHEMLQKFIDAH